MKRSKTIPIRVTEEEHLVFHDYARKCGMTLSDVIRALVTETIEDFMALENGKREPVFPEVHE